MSSLTFSMELATSLYNSEVEFPVDFDDLWQWCGYSRKDSALRTLQEEMAESIDFAVSHVKVEDATAFGGFRKTAKYYTTIDAAKMFAMMAKTDEGRQVRKYFLVCEKVAKESVITPIQPVKQLPSFVEYTHAALDLQKSSLPHAIKQLLLDKMGDELCTGQKVIAPSVEPLKMGVAQRAEELGFKVDRSNRTKLGKFMAAQGLKSFKEKRLCEGTARAINVYEVSDELDELIGIYFNN